MSILQFASGRPCLPWADFSISDDGELYIFPDETLEEASSFCRNPDKSKTPWCYVDLNGERENCNVLKAGEEYI